MRNSAIQIYVDKSKLTEQQINYLESNKDIDFEYNAANKKDTIWIHDDGNFPFSHEILQELIQMLSALLGVSNPRTGLDHLDLFIESSEIDEYGIEIFLESGTVKYKNIRASELSTIDLSKVMLKRELYQL
jgi:hypothetical protein